MRQALALIAVLLITAASVARAGWQYTAVTKGDGSDQRGAMASSTIKGFANGEKSRVEFTESGNPMTPAGSYLVTKDGGKIMYLVNPAQKKYTTWDIESMMGFAGGAMEMMNMKFSEPKVEKLVDEKGPTIADFPTRHVRFRTAFTMEMNFMGFKQTTENLTEEDIWSSDALKDAGLGVWLNQKGMKTGNEQLDKMMQAEMDKVQGFPLRRIVVTTAKQSDGKVSITKITTEVTEIKKADTPATIFELPAGYTEAPMFPGAGTGSKQPGAKDGTDAENPLLKMMQQMNKGK